MPIGGFLNQLPPAFFLVVHLVAFVAAAYFASRAFAADIRPLAWGFVLYAIAEISYMTYHLDWTVFLFAHTISEVLDLVAFVLVFVSAALPLRAAARHARSAGA
jgi:hypothetical protein